MGFDEVVTLSIYQLQQVFHLSSWTIHSPVLLVHQLVVPTCHHRWTTGVKLDTHRSWGKLLKWKQKQKTIASRLVLLSTCFVMLTHPWFRRWFQWSRPLFSIHLLHDQPGNAPDVNVDKASAGSLGSIFDSPFRLSPEMSLAVLPAYYVRHSSSFPTIRRGANVSDVFSPFAKVRTRIVPVQPHNTFATAASWLTKSLPEISEMMGSLGVKGWNKTMTSKNPKKGWLTVRLIGVKDSTHVQTDGYLNIVLHGGFFGYILDYCGICL